MSGSYIDAAGPTIVADKAMIDEAVNAAYSATQHGQFQSRQFISVQAGPSGHGDTVGSAGAPVALEFEGPVQ